MSIDLEKLKPDQEFLATLNRPSDLEMDWKHWYSGEDPVVRSVLSEALKHLGLKTFPDEDIETLRTTLPEYVNKMYEILDQTKDWPAVRELGGSWEYDDDTGSYRDTGAPLDIDVVDHLMAIRYLKDWSVRNKQVWKDKDVELNLEHALMLLTLGEAKANRPGVAIKAFYVGSSLRPEEGYRQFQKQIHGKRRGGRKSGTTKREENAERDEKMRADAVRRLKDRDDRIKIVQDLSEQHGITRDRVNQILRGTPGWPTRSRKSKRNHT